MYCPKCKGNTKVINTRDMQNINGTMRRRKCLDLNCDNRFTTYEEYEGSKDIEELKTLRDKLRRALLEIAIVEDILKKDNDG